jgi:SWIM zinc finger
VVITISSDDARSIKAIEIAAGAGQWLKCRTSDGRKAYGVPSQRHLAHFHLVDCTSCTCPDFQRRQEACKHVLAVRLHCELVKATQPPARTATRDRRHLRLLPMPVVALAAKYDEIFKRFAED